MAAYPPLTIAVCVIVICAQMVNISAAGDGRPVVRIDSGLVAGQRITYNNKPLDVFYGIPYAKPPVGSRRYERPQLLETWTGVFNATRKPDPCKQTELLLSENVVANYSHASEDCLYVNVIAPVCSSSSPCAKLRPVMVYIQGGAFQWGDSTLFHFNGTNFVALTDVVFVSFNYRLGVFGFLSAERAELPGNMGLWDQNLLLKWVKKNIANFGGNPEEITLTGHSAGGISASIHAISPHSRGLFKRMILQSGTPVPSIMTLAYRGVGKLFRLAGLLGCDRKGGNSTDHISDIVRCMKTKDASEIVATVERQTYRDKIFVPVTGDEFLPGGSHIRDSLIINSAQIFAGTTLNEGTLLVESIRHASPAFVEALSGDYRTGIALAAKVLLGLSVAEARRLVHSYFGGDEVERDTQEVINILAELIGDVAFRCPTHFYLSAAAEQGISSYGYVFAHRSPGSARPEWMGVTHMDELGYTLGSLPHIMDEATNKGSRWQGISKALHLGRSFHTDKEEEFMKEVVGIWKSFIVEGKPSVPHSEESWPDYSASTPDVIYLQPRNYTRATAHRLDRCRLWSSFPKYGRHSPSKGPSARTPAQTRKPPRKDNKRTGNILTAKSSGDLSSTSFLAFIFVLLVPIWNVW